MPRPTRRACLDTGTNAHTHSESAVPPTVSGDSRLYRRLTGGTGRSIQRWICRSTRPSAKDAMRQAETRGSPAVDGTPSASTWLRRESLASPEGGFHGRPVAGSERQLRDGFRVHDSPISPRIVPCRSEGNTVAGMHHAVSRSGRSGMSSTWARVGITAVLACAASVGAEDRPAAPLTLHGSSNPIERSADSAWCARRGLHAPRIK